MSGLTNRMQTERKVRKLGTAERRQKILILLCRRRHDTIENLASEFGVSERTIRRDIEALSATDPIYTQTGRHGGVYVADGYYLDRQYMSNEEISLLKKVQGVALQQGQCVLSVAEISLLANLIDMYSKPTKK